MKYGIKIDKSVRGYPKTKHGVIWVDETEENYTTRKKAKTWKTKKEATKAIYESWEMIEVL